MRWGDMDAQRHINNAAFVDYLQEARVDFLLSGPPVLQELLATGVLVTSHQVEYLRPVEYHGEPVRIELWVDGLGGSRFFIGYELFDGQHLVARARTAAVPFDLATGSLRRLRAEERAALAAVSRPAQPLAPVARVSLSQAAHSCQLRVRWADLDSYGHVNNVKFYEYIQQARIDLMTRTVEWPPEAVWVVVRQDLDYLRPLDFRPEPYQVRTAVAKVGNRSFTLAADISDPLSGAVFATAATVVVGQAALTEDERAGLARWQSTPEPDAAGRRIR